EWLPGRRWLWQAVSAPSREVRHENVIVEMELDLVQDPPATGSALSPKERSDEIAAEEACHVRMRERRPWGDDELALDDLSNNVLREREEIFVGGRFFRRRGHRLKFTHATGLLWTRRAGGDAKGRIGGAGWRSAADRGL